MPGLTCDAKLLGICGFAASSPLPGDAPSAISSAIGAGIAGPEGEGGGIGLIFGGMGRACPGLGEELAHWLFSAGFAIGRAIGGGIGGPEGMEGGNGGSGWAGCFATGGRDIGGIGLPFGRMGNVCPALGEELAHWLFSAGFAIGPAIGGGIGGPEGMEAAGGGNDGVDCVAIGGRDIGGFGPLFDTMGRGAGPALAGESIEWS
jgi:hypothetical protein